MSSTAKSSSTNLPVQAVTGGDSVEQSLAKPKLPKELAELFPFQSRFMTVGGHRMHYVDEGEGEVVLCLHGNPTWSFYYRNLILALRSKYRVIALDYIGMGLSDRPANAHFRATDRTRDVEEFLKNLKVTRYSLVMHDWGGSIGTMLAVRNPESIIKLIYLNTTLTETESLPFIIKQAASPVIGKFLTRTTKRFLKVTTEWGVFKKLPPAVKRGYLYPYPTRASRTSIWDFVADIPFDSAHPTYANMLVLADGIPKLSHVPTLIAWGLRDPCFHREMLSQVARHFPHAEVIEIPQGSHLVLEDAPELVISSIQTFLGGEALRRSTIDQVTVGSGRDLLRGAHPMYREFLQHAEKNPTHDAVVEPLFLMDEVQYRHFNFGDLATRINKYQRGLFSLGLVAGDRVVILVPPGVEFLALSFAVMARGAVPVFLDPGMGTNNLLRCIEEVNPQAFIGSLKAQILRLLKKDLFKRVKFNLTAHRWSFIRGRDLSFLQRFSSGALQPGIVGSEGLIAYTSGATGVPKGVIYTPEMIDSQLMIFRERFGLTPGEKDLPLLPVFSLFSLASGIGSIFAPMNPAKPLAMDPSKIVRVIHDLNPTSSFGSPTLWNKIAEYGVRTRQKLPSLKKVFIAGAPVSAEVLTRVREVLDGGESYTPYGATEALPVTLVSASEILATEPTYATTGELGTLVGRAIPEVELKVVKIVEENIATIQDATQLPPRQIGEILVRGRNVSARYLFRNDATLAAKVKDGDTFWHRMGDVGYLDESGNLYFCGRKVHRVIHRERAFYSVPVERIFNKHPKVKRAALVGLGKDFEPGIVIEPHPQAWPASEDERNIFRSELQALASANPLTSSISRFFFYESFPVDPRHNAKIYRDKLATWANEQPQGV